MSNVQRSESVLVIVEGQAACPYWMNHWGVEPEADWSMLEQEEWESAEAFLARLDTTFDRDGLSAPATTVILVSSAAVDGTSMTARWELANRVMNHLLRSGGGELVVTRGFGHRGQAQPALQALVADLVDEWDGSNCRATLRLVQPPPASRVRSSVAAPALEHSATA